MSDLRYAVRTLLKNPGFSAVVVITLALAIGATTAIFSVMNAVLFRPLPVEDPDRLVILMHRRSYSYPLFRDIQDRQRLFSGIFASSGQQPVYQAALENGAAIGPLNVGIVSGDYFRVLGVRPAAGRTLTADDDRTPGAHPVAVISHRFWERQFSRASSAVGFTLRLRQTPFTIVGIAPDGFFGESAGESPDLWVPLTMQPEVQGKSALEGRTKTWLKIFGRLADGVSVPQAEAAMTGVIREIVASGVEPLERGDRVEDHRIELRAGAKGWAGLRRYFERPLWVLASVVGLVLLIACCNVAGLHLVRATARRHEIAVRLALGCSRLRLARQLVMESLLLSFAGGAMGLWLALFGSEALVALVSDPSEPFILHLQPDWRVLSFTGAVSLVTGLFFGLAPARQALRATLGGTLQSPLRHSQGRATRRVGKTLVVAQVAISLTLLVAAGLFVRTLTNLLSIETGFERRDLLLVGVHDEPALPADRLALVHQQLNAVPGVRSASFATDELMTEGSWTSVFSRPGDVQRPRAPQVRAIAVSPEYFPTVGIPLIAGRDFTAGDQPAAPRIAVVNETLARKYFGEASPIGSRATLGREFDPSKAFEIVGVVRDARYDDLRSPAQPMVYLPIFQHGEAFESVEVRAAANPAAVAAAVRRVLEQHRVVVLDVRTMDEQVARTLSEERMFVRLCGTFALLALLLACVGLYGMLAFTVAQRTPEIAVRMALGASQARVLRQVLGEAGLLVGLGLTLGVATTLAAVRGLSGLLFGLTPTDPVTMAAAVGTLGLIALFAAYLPARRAARVEPMAALRAE